MFREKRETEGRGREQVSRYIIDQGRGAQVNALRIWNQCQELIDKSKLALML